ncbi:peptidoglycan recognition protein family protein [Cohnella herbarum]|uniref:N-acetylmuramoyl-L-alanine amidase n=1 Tax=Cohnella herbarum TaxID=2728023 RepID=A0A7Z2VEK3_9BACL|nr:N-acetylmuramoyl-L-alanine amidase [Cohnella herbarum]QJD81733.1 N-acetylmuramoyl-L-alanine amidase [Cohnella herbarum]
MEYIVNHIPMSTPHRRRQGIKCTMTTITIHNTGNPTSNALGERSWLFNPTNGREASWHIVVDEHRAIEAIPLNEKALHAGDAVGNTSSIGVEICESGDYSKTLRNAAQLVAKMLKARGWGVAQLRRHWDWSHKICPRLMYDGGKWTGWEAFKSMVSAELAEKGEDEPMTKEEKQMLDAMREDVAAIKLIVDSSTKLTPAPKWFVTEFGSVDLAGKIGKPEFTEEGWRTLAVSLRMQGLGKK